MTLIDKINDAFAEFLDSMGFRKVSYSIDDKHFGNEIAEYASSAHRIRFVTDRGDFLIHIASNAQASKWHSLGTVLELLGYPYGEVAGVDDVEIVRLLRAEHGQIARLFSEENTERTLEDLANLQSGPIPRLN